MKTFHTKGIVFKKQNKKTPVKIKRNALNLKMFFLDHYIKQQKVQNY